MKQATIRARLAPGLTIGWRPALLRWLLAAHYALFGLLAGAQSVLWEDLRRALALGEGALGTAMLLTPLVGFCVLVAGQRAFSRLSRQRLAMAALAVVACALLTMTLAANLWGLLLFRALSGVGFALLEGAVTNAALDWEQATGRRTVSLLYAVFSMGALGGALLAGALLRVGWGYAQVLAALVPAFALLAAATGCVAYPARHRLASAAPALPIALLRNRRFLALAAVCLLGVCAEALADMWMTIYLRGLGADALMAGVAFALFSAAIIAGRLTNASLLARWGGRAPLRLACAASLIALALLAWGGLAGAVAAFVTLGLGVAGVTPTVLGAAQAQLAPQRDAAVNGIVATTYLGFVVAPPAVGWLAEWLGLQPALLVVLAVAALGLGWLSREAG
jgi:MFS family permease